MLDQDEGWSRLRRGGELQRAESEKRSRDKRADETDEEEIDILGQRRGTVM